MTSILRFENFIYTIHTYYANYVTLLYANFMFKENFSNYLSKDERGDKSFVIGYSVHEEPGGDMLLEHRLTEQMIYETIEQFQKGIGKDYDFTINDIMASNIHFIKTRVLNAFYEIILKYLENRGLNEIYEMHSHNWFRMLYVLRNLASHADGLNQEVFFPDRANRYKNKIEPYPEILEYATIKITRQQSTPVEYNALEILPLLREALSFFQSTLKYQSPPTTS